MKSRLYEIMEVSDPEDRIGRAFDLFIVGLISLNVLVVILETVSSIKTEYSAQLRYIELISVIIFSVEYLLRLWTCTTNVRYRSPVSGRIRFMFTPLLLIDLVAILPFYLPMVISLDLRFLRAIRMLRVLRILKFARYSESLQVMGTVIRNSRTELLVTLFIMAVLLIIASCTIYFVENPAQPDVFSSIPAAIWWGIITLTTVGYGDTYPITAIGKTLAALVSILGIGLFALPAGIIGSGFVTEIQRRKNSPTICPHCGKEIEEK